MLALLSNLIYCLALRQCYRKLCSMARSIMYIVVSGSCLAHSRLTRTAHSFFEIPTMSGSSFDVSKMSGFDPFSLFFNDVCSKTIIYVSYSYDVVVLSKMIANLTPTETSVSSQTPAKQPWIRALKH